MDTEPQKPTSDSNKFIRVIIFLGLAIAIISLYLLFGIEEPKKPMVGHGTMHTGDADIGGNFELIDQDGKPFNSESLKGKISLIYFGFTYCPDICPTSLQKLTEVMNTLDKYNIPANSVFITIDPKRDTQAVLQEYLKHFHHKFIGLTGTPEQVKAVADKFKVYYAIAATNTKNDDVHYMIDHSSFIYLMDKKGKYLKHFYMNSSPEEIVEFIRTNCRN
jgi:protein SCO1/2